MMEQFPGAEEVKNDVEPSAEEKKEETYEIPAESYVNPNNMTPLPESKRENRAEVLDAHFVYENMIGDVLLHHTLNKELTGEEIEALAVQMVDQHMGEIEVMAETEQNEVIENAEVENKAEMEKPEGKMSLFERAVITMKGYLTEHPKVAKLAIAGTIAYELGNNPAYGHGYGGGYNPGYAIANTIQSAVVQSGYNQMNGQAEAAEAMRNGQQGAQIQYQNQIQSAEVMRANAYQTIDASVYQWRSQGMSEDQIARGVYNMRMQIEQQYGNDVSRAQSEYQMNQQQIQMDQQQIMQQRQMQQQYINYTAGAQITNQVIGTALHAIFH